jgi:hypothetical protein
LEPACGDGNFLVRIIAWKIHKGSTAKQALETTFGVDLMEDNVSHARARVLTNAFAAQQWKKTDNSLMPGLSHEDERLIGMSKGHDAFAKKHNAIVARNVVCHDGLTYDYSFGETVEEIDELKHLKDIGFEF